MNAIAHSALVGSHLLWLGEQGVYRLRRRLSGHRLIRLDDADSFAPWENARATQCDAAVR